MARHRTAVVAAKLGNILISVLNSGARDHQLRWMTMTAKKPIKSLCVMTKTMTKMMTEMIKMIKMTMMTAP